MSERTRAYETLETAKVLLAHGSPEGTINRAFYAMFYAVRYYLQQRHGIDPRRIKTHNGIITAFSQKAVLADGIAPMLGRAFNQLEEKRLISDYDVEDTRRPDIETARQAVQDAAYFIDVVVAGADSEPDQS